MEILKAHLMFLDLQFAPGTKEVEAVKTES
jgi:hypothetical protein